MSKKLVAYFSASGVTGNVAKALAEVANADLYEIKPQVPYTKADLDWMDKKFRSTIEMQDKNSIPAMADYNTPVEGADVIFVGFPIWWYVAPHIINSFLEAYDFSGKTIVLFATSGGSDFGRTLEALEDSVRGTVHLMEGKLLSGKHSMDELKKWVEGLGL